MPLNFFNTMVQKSQQWPKTQLKGDPALTQALASNRVAATECCKINFLLPAIVTESKQGHVVLHVTPCDLHSWYLRPSICMGLYEAHQIYILGEEVGQNRLSWKSNHWPIIRLVSYHLICHTLLIQKCSSCIRACGLEEFFKYLWKISFCLTIKKIMEEEGWRGGGLAENTLKHPPNSHVASTNP